MKSLPPPSAAHLFPLPMGTSDMLSRCEPLLVRDIDALIAGWPGMEEAVPESVLQLVSDLNHLHVTTLCSVIRLGDADLFARHVTWIYRTLLLQQAGASLFPILLAAWKEALRTHLPESVATPLVSLHNWIRHHHDAFIDLASAND